MSPLFRPKNREQPEADPRLVAALIGNPDKVPPVLIRTSATIIQLLEGEGCLGVATDSFDTSVLVITGERTFVVTKNSLSATAPHSKVTRTVCGRLQSGEIIVGIEASECVYPALKSGSDRYREGANTFTFGVRNEEDGFAIRRLVDARRENDEALPSVLPSIDGSSVIPPAGQSFPARGAPLMISDTEVPCNLERSEFPASVSDLAVLAVRRLGIEQSQSNFVKVLERLTQMQLISIDKVFREILKEPEAGRLAESILVEDGGLRQVRALAARFPRGDEILDLQFIKSFSMLTSKHSASFLGDLR